MRIQVIAIMTEYLADCPSWQLDSGGSAGRVVQLLLMSSCAARSLWNLGFRMVRLDITTHQTGVPHPQSKGHWRSTRPQCSHLPTLFVHSQPRRLLQQRQVTSLLANLSSNLLVARSVTSLLYERSHAIESVSQAAPSDHTVTYSFTIWGSNSPRILSKGQQQRQNLEHRLFGA